LSASSFQSISCFSYGPPHFSSGFNCKSIHLIFQFQARRSGQLTSSPRLSRSLVTGLLAHGVGLALVLSHAGVDLLDNIGSDGRGKDGRDRMGSSRRSTIFADDSDGRSGGHREVAGLCETCGLVRNRKLHKARLSWQKPKSVFWGWYAYLDSGVDGLAELGDELARRKLQKRSQN
jgi:hypothetical protein